MTHRIEPIDFAAMPPGMVLYSLATGFYVSRALYVVAQLGIADRLRDGPRSAEELAAATKTHARSLRRVLRLLVSAGVFDETEDGAFALTPVSECLRSDVPGTFLPATLLFAGPLEWASWGALPHAVETGEMALQHVFGVGPFEYMHQHPDESAVFDAAMAAFTSMTALAVAAAYDFTGMHSVVDIGGGNGALLVGLLKTNPHLRGVVFDQPQVVEGATKQIGAADLADRCSVAGGDFFATIPGGADAYLIKHVLHDWDDDRATAILRSCRHAMAATAKLLVIEGIYPERIGQDVISRGATRNDVNMLVVTGGRQRSEAEFRELFAASGFHLARIVPTLAGVSVIEANRL